MSKRKTEQSGHSEQTKSIGELTRTFLDSVTPEHERIPVEHDESTDTLMTGLPSLDHTLEGLKGGHLHLVGSRPGTGKTQFLKTLARNVAIQQEVPTLFYSFASATEQLVQQILELTAGMAHHGTSEDRTYTDAHRIRLKEASRKLQDTPLLFSDDQMDTTSLVDHIKRMNHEHHLELIMLDGPGNLSDFDGTRKQGKELLNNLKQVADELDVVIVSTVDLEENDGTHTPFHPEHAHFDRTTAMEHPVDVLLLLYRDFYYTADQNRKSITEIMIARNSAGPTRPVKLKYDRENMIFCELPPGYSSHKETGPSSNSSFQHGTDMLEES
jgi:replicative DNA helicase